MVGSLREMDRRRFLARSAWSSVAAVCCGRAAIATEKAERRNKICAFIKFLQSLSYERLAEVIAELGFDGIEATVRRGGHVLPERVEEDLPKLVEALAKHELEITVMASDVNRVDQPHAEKVLRTAAALGVRCYRMAYYRYDLSQPLPQQLDQLRPVLRDLVAMNRELGIRAVYQNHAGDQIVGAPLWDLYQLIKDYAVSEVGVAFDIRHATVEGGLSWPIEFQLMRPHLGAVYVKDFCWDEGQKRPRNVPLGEGRVDKRFFTLLSQSNYRGPISLHIEYLQQQGTAANIEALRTDLATLQRWLGI